MGWLADVLPVLLVEKATHLLPLFLNLLKDEHPEARLSIISKQVHQVMGIVQPSRSAQQESPLAQCMLHTSQHVVLCGRSTCGPSEERCCRW